MVLRRLFGEVLILNPAADNAVPHPVAEAVQPQVQFARNDSGLPFGMSRRATVTVWVAFVVLVILNAPRAGLPAPFPLHVYSQTSGVNASVLRPDSGLFTDFVKIV